MTFLLCFLLCLVAFIEKILNLPQSCWGMQNFVAVQKSRGHWEWQCIYLWSTEGNRSSVLVWRGKSRISFCGIILKGRTDSTALKGYRPLVLESATRRIKNYSNWLKNPRMCPKSSRFPSCCGTRAKTGHIFLQRSVMTTALVWDSSQNTPEIFIMLAKCNALSKATAWRV